MIAKDSNLKRTIAKIAAALQICIGNQADGYEQTVSTCYTKVGTIDWDDPGLVFRYDEHGRMAKFVFALRVSKHYV